MAKVDASRQVTILDDYVLSGLGIAYVGSGADVVSVAEGRAVLNGAPVFIGAQATLSLTAPAASGNVRRNFIYVDKSTNVLAVYAAPETGTTGYDISDYLKMDSDQAPDSVDHNSRMYLDYVDVNDVPGSADITIWEQRLGRGI